MKDLKSGVWSIWVKDNGGDLHVVGLVCAQQEVMDYMEELAYDSDCERVYWSADVAKTATSYQIEREERRLYAVTKFTGPIHIN